MIRFNLLCDVRIHPNFWVTALILAFFFSSGNIAGMLIWVGIIFLSVLVHEFGHAIAAKSFGKQPRITLLWKGGLTEYDGRNLSLTKQFIIIACGPFFGFLLFLIAFLGMALIKNPTEFVNYTFFNTAQLNLFWTAINLFPIGMLDGGQLLRIILQAIFGRDKGARYVHIVGAVVAVGVALIFFAIREVVIGVIFFYLAMASVTQWQASRFVTNEDFDDEIQNWIVEAEKAFLKEDTAKAKNLYLKICGKVSQGEIFHIAMFRLAKIEDLSGEHQLAYNRLKSLEVDLDPEQLLIYYRLAFELEDYEKVRQLAPTVHQYSEVIPDSKEQMSIPLRAAYAFAESKEPEKSVHWLESAIQMGLSNPRKVIADKLFDDVRHSGEFQALIKKLGDDES